MGRISAWMARAHGGLMYRMTQVIVGHGCFEAYLHEIRKSESPICRHCRAAIDNGVHIPLSLVGCGEGELVRGSRSGSRSRVIEAIMGSSVAWTAFARFCEVVMRAKERADRDRRRDRRARVVHPLVPPSLLWGFDFS